MKRIFLAATAAIALATTAQAADLGARPVYKAPPAQVLAYNWSGVYIGGHIGWGWQDGDATLTTASGGFPAGTVLSSRSDGFLGGGQIGVNWQTGNWVLGLEGDFSWTNADGTASATVGGVTSTGTVDYNWFATATARVGYAMNDWLFYVKGGAAFADLDLGGSLTAGGALLATVNGQSDTRTGWTIGAGVERAIMGNWSWKLEYNYMDFGSETVTTTTTPVLGAAAVTDQELTAHAVKFGINYRFGRM
jgi:outer membrane immunogenic protein